MISVLAVVFVFGILIFVHEFGHFIVAKKNGVRVERFAFGLGPKLWGRKVGETEYLICAVPFGGYIKMAGDEPDKEIKGRPWEYLSKTCGQRAQIVAAGPFLNYLLAFFLFSFIFIIGAPVSTTRVGKLLPGYPAEKAGIKEGDVILQVDGEKVRYWTDMAETIHRKTEKEGVILDIKREKRSLQIKLQPTIQETADIFGEKMQVALIGISPSEETVKLKYGAFRSFYEGGKKLIYLTGFTYKSLWFIITGRLSFKDSVAGPIQMFQLTSSAARMGFVYLLHLMGLLSMSLAVFNFLPLPVLDGGHIFFIALEKLRRRPLSARAQELATQTGLVLLVALMLFVSYQDLIRIGVLDKIAQWWGR